MTPTEQSIATERSIIAAREYLTEARRWCRTKPEAAADGIESANRVLWAMNTDIGTRLMDNLHESMIYLLACPTMAEGYIDGALFELQAFGDRLRRKREAGERDADLAEAYATKGDGTDV